jgi:4'-phosphopantetheinyl transferase
MLETIILSKLQFPLPPIAPLAINEVHIWYTLIEHLHAYVTEFSSILSADETTRARRFYFVNDRERYIIGRGLLRRLLASYLDLEPSQIQFTYGACGKPELRAKKKGNELRFNLSHSKDLLIYAFCWDRLVGIDVEHIHSMPDEQRLAEEFFSAPESAFLQALSGNQRLEAFFKLWTCKEAFLKATGDGLAKSMDQFEIQLAGGELARLVSIEGDPNQAVCWHLETFEPVPGYQAALAIEQEISSPVHPLIHMK